MSELHTYQIHVVVAPGRSAMRHETAFSAADALTQFRLLHWREEVYKIEPLPDAPQNVRAPAGLKPKLAAAPLSGSDWPTSSRSTDEARRFERENVELHAAIFGHAFGSVTHDQAVAEAKRLRAEAQTLRWEHDHAIASASAAARASCPGPATGTARAATPKDRIEALEAVLRERTAERDEAQTTAQACIDALCKIGRVVWPEGASRAYAPDELVEAVRRMGAETEDRRKRCVDLRMERDTLQRQNEAGSAEVVAEMEKTRAAQHERDALRSELDKVRDLLKAEHRAYEEANRLRGQAIDQRDALQKRIDAGVAYIVDGGQDRNRLQAILEGREP